MKRTTELSLIGLKNSKNRIKFVQKELKKLRIDAYFVYYLPNVSYLTGFRGSSGYVLITKKKAFFITDFRYKEVSQKEIDKNFEIIIHSGLARKLKEFRFIRYIKRIGFEKAWVPYGTYRSLQKELGKKFVPCPDLVRKIRICKNEEEIKNIIKAQRLNEKIFEEIISFIKPGKTKELDLAAEIEYRMKKIGGESAFSPIVAVGTNSALPHAKPCNRVIKKGKPLKIDMGVKYKGWCSDMTRTVWIGSKPDERFKKIYQVVLDANKKAIDAVRAGVSGKDVDAVARKHIEEAGYGKYFGHGVGHGIGVEVHELPSLSPLSKDKLEKGMVFTIEPGIYIPGYGGVRIEDLVCIRNGDKFVITKTPKNLVIL